MELKQIIKIGSGAYSSVYKYVDPKTSETYAIKIPSSWETPYFHTILREGLLLRHSFGVPCIGLCHKNQHLMGYVMPKAMTTLNKWLIAFQQDPKQFKPIVHSELFLHFLQQVLLQLLKLHLAGFVHADVKGKNIVLFETGHAFLCDFGLSSKANNEPFMPSSTDAHVYTPSHRPPELFEQYSVYNDSNSVALHPSMDMWALGLTIYECFFGLTLKSSDSSEIYGELQDRVPRKLEDRMHLFEDLFSLRYGRLHHQTKLVTLMALLLEYDPAKRLSAYEALSHLPKDFKITLSQKGLYDCEKSMVQDLEFEIVLFHEEEESDTVQLRPSQHTLCTKISDTLAKLIQFDVNGFQVMGLALFKLFETKGLGQSLVERKVLHDLSLLRAVVANMFCIYLFRTCVELKMAECAKIVGLGLVHFEILVEEAMYMALRWPSWASAWTKSSKCEP